MSQVFLAIQFDQADERIQDEALHAFLSRDDADRFVEEKKIGKDLDSYKMRWRSNWLDVEEAKGLQWLIQEHRDRYNKDQKML